MLSVHPSLDATAHRELRARLGPRPSAAGPVDRPAVLAALVADLPCFSDRAQHMLRAPEAWFAVDRMAEQSFWTHQDLLFERVAAGVDAATALIARFVPPARDDRRVDVTVVPVPGLLSCYGTDHGRQVFGLYDQAEPAEAVLFLAHTYYHEITEVLDDGAPAGQSPAGAVRTHLMRLVRNEGVANYAVLADVLQLRDTGVPMRYFDYADMVGNDAACARAMDAYRTLTTRITDETAARAIPQLEAAFKNPRLPVINLLGIQMARAVARCHGEAALIDIDGQHPEAFFRLYQTTDDPLRAGLAGVDGVASTVAAA